MLCIIMVIDFLKQMLHKHVWGGADGRVVKALDSQPQDRGFEYRHTLGLLCLRSLGKICTPNVPSGDRYYAIACLLRTS